MSIDAFIFGLLRGNFQPCFIFLEDWLTRLITAVLDGPNTEVHRVVFGFSKFCSECKVFEQFN